MKNSADLGGCYPPRPSASVDNTLLDLQNSSYPTQPHSIIAKYFSQKYSGSISEETGYKVCIKCLLVKAELFLYTQLTEDVKVHMARKINHFRNTPAVPILMLPSIGSPF